MLQKFEPDFPKVSIVTPFFNAALFIKDAIESVLNQSYQNWELILINDGSLDESKSIAQKYLDKRILYFEQDNKGVAAARNVGLAMMTGDFFCFLDADDVLPPDSLLVRLEQFKSDSFLTFVDGQVVAMDFWFKEIKRKWLPNFKGNPLKDLVSLSGNSFFGATWMIRRNSNRNYQMKEGLSHSEDLLFYMELSREGELYGYTSEVILRYRDSPKSAMKNLEGLENGYLCVYQIIKQWTELDSTCLNNYKNRVKKIMFRSYLRKGLIRKAWNILNAGL